MVQRKMEQRRYNSFCYETEAGKLIITDNGRPGKEAAITGTGFLADASLPCVEQETPVIRRAWEELQEYIEGRRKVFDLPCEMHGTAFQMEVWQALCAIPYGQTRTYGEIAAQIGRPKACRAVGQANHNNPIGIFVPCHRVIGSSGKLTGYAGGLDKKEWLLAIERKYR